MGCTGNFEEAELAELQAVFDEIWATVKARDPHRDLNRDNELKTSIAQMLMNLAAVGITKPEELRRRCLETAPPRSRLSFRKGASAEVPPVPGDALRRGPAPR